MTELTFPLCHHCRKKIWNNRTCVEVKGHLYCQELCADREAIAKLRRVKTLHPVK
jgi:hypothetical protein